MPELDTTPTGVWRLTETLRAGLLDLSALAFVSDPSPGTGDRAHVLARDLAPILDGLPRSVVTAALCAHLDDVLVRLRDSMVKHGVAPCTCPPAACTSSCAMCDAKPAAPCPHGDSPVAQRGAQAA